MFSPSISRASVTHLRGCHALIALRLLVHEPGVAEVRGEHRELVGAVAGALQRADERGLEKRDRALDVVVGHAFVADAIDLAHHFRFEGRRRSSPGAR